MAWKRGCQCEGHWATRLVNYVVLQREYAIVEGERRSSRYSTIKCYKCYHKWRSDAQYIAKLPDGKERVYKKLTDADVLDLMRSGRIVVNPETGEIVKQRRILGGRWLDEDLVLRQSVCPAGYLFVDIKNGGARKRSAVHRMVWMWVHNELIPDDCDIDHLDRRRDNPCIRNLRVRNTHENRGDNRGGNTHGRDAGKVPF